jgi:predicted Zn-dependent protease
MKNSSRWLGLFAVALLLGLAVGGVIAWLQACRQTPANFLNAGETAYAAGIDAFLRNDDGAAALRFHEAMLQADSALKALEANRNNLQDRPAELQAWQVRLEGLAYWLKLKGLRARVAAKLRSEGKELPAVDGARPNQPREYFSRLLPSRLPDEAARAEALWCLRQAALRLTDVEEVQRDAVNQEMQLEPKHWPIAQLAAESLLKFQPQDERAHYILARFHFEQPQPMDGSAPAAPMPPAKRSQQRMQKALQHLAAVKETEKPARWRTLHLDAEVHHWLAGYFRKPDHRRPEAERQALAELDALLFGAEGALARAAQTESFGTLSRLDTEGLLSLHGLALERAIESKRQHSLSRERKGADKEPLTDVRGSDAGMRGSGADVRGSGASVAGILQALIQTTSKLTRHEPTPLQVGLCFDALAWAGPRAQPFLAGQDAAIWSSFIESLKEQARAALAHNQGEIGSYLRVAEVLGRDAEVARKRGETNPAGELSQQALSFLDAGLAQATARQLPPRHALPLHEAALRLKGRLGAKREDLQAHLQALRESNLPLAQASACLFEGALLEKEGRLEKARDSLARAASLGAGADVARRAHTALAPLYLTLGQPDQALRSIQVIQDAYARWDRLADDEREWLVQLLHNPQEVVLLKLQAHLACAAEAWRRFALRADAAGGEPLERMKEHEAQAAKMLGQLPEKSALNRVVREKVIAHLAATRRLDQARPMLEDLRRDFPTSVSVLRLENQLALAGAATPAQRGEIIAALDVTIRQFIQGNPASAQARLYFAEWLLATNRAPEAAAYLADPAVAAATSGLGLQYQRLKALAHLATGAPISEVQQAGGADPLVDLALIQTADATDQQDKQPGEALLRYENNGLFRCVAAKRAAERRDYTQAAREYADALEITQVSPIARSGLQAVLFTLARQNPDEARNLTAELLQQRTAEPALLLAYAECCFLMSNLGEPGARKTKIEDMATALSAYEQAREREAPDQPDGPWVKAQYWQRANRPDLARGELTRLLARFPDHEAGLALVVQLALADGGAEACSAALPYVHRLKQNQPDSPVPLVMESQLQARLKQREPARTTLKNCLDRFPKCAAAYAALIELLFEDGQTEAALAMVRAWQQVCPDDFTPWQAEIRLLAANGQAKEAAQLLAEQVKLLRTRLQSVDFRGRPDLEMAVESMYTVELCRGLIHRKTYAAAAEVLERLLEARPNDEAALLLLGEVCLTQLRESADEARRATFAAQAKAAFAKVYAQRKGHLIAGNNLAWLLTTADGDAREALRLLNEVRTNRYTQKPMPAETLPAEMLDTFGLAYHKLNQPAQAAEEIALFETARQRYPNDPRFCLHLGRALLRAGKKAEADKQFTAALTLLNQPSATIDPEASATLAKELQSARQASKQD